LFLTMQINRSINHLMPFLVRYVDLLYCRCYAVCSKAIGVKQSIASSLGKLVCYTDRGMQYNIHSSIGYYVNRKSISWCVILHLKTCYVKLLSLFVSNAEREMKALR
jgi:hypothetical protein